MTLTEIERALDQGLVQCAIHNRYGFKDGSKVHWWDVRRGGTTKLWKTRPGDFRIPVKYGMYGHGEITQDTIGKHTFRIVHQGIDDNIVGETLI